MFAAMILAKTECAAGRLDPKIWLSALYPKHAPDISGHFKTAQICLVEAGIFNTPQSHALKSVPLSADHLHVSFWGRLDNRASLIATLDIKGPPQDITDHSLILHGWQRWGEQITDNIIGDFAFAVIDTKTDTVFLARDPMGVKPFYYIHNDDGLFFASTVGALLKIPNIKASPDPDWMMRYIVRQSFNSETTAYKEIKKLAPACSLVLRGNTLKIRRYHQWRDDAPFANAQSHHWVDDYKAMLETVIRDQSQSDYRMGVENSGGIDSSTIAAFLANTTDNTADDIYSFAYATLQDEAAHIASVNQSTGIINSFVLPQYGLSGEAAAEARIEALDFAGYPEEHGNGMGHWPFYTLAKSHGIRTLFSGFGGDECVTNYAQIARLELIDNRQFWAYSKTMRGGWISQLLRGAKNFRKYKTSPRFNPRMKRTLDLSWGLHPLRDNEIAPTSIQADYIKASQYDAPYRRDNDWLINGLLSQPFISTRLENCTLMAAYHGLDYRWPLIDVRLIQQYLSTPVIERHGPQNLGRYLHRRAIDGVVPDGVTWKQNKYMGEKIVPLEQRAWENIEISHGALQPVLADIIDPQKWTANISQLNDPNTSTQRKIMLKRQADAVETLDVWLGGTR